MSLRTYLRDFISALPEALIYIQNCSDSKFEKNVTALLLEATTSLEQQRNYYKGAKEEQMTGTLLGFFHRYGIRANSQTNSNGHVDVFVYKIGSPQLVICIEAKIWKGSKRHITSDMAQIMRYASGRYPFSYLLVYFREKNITKRMEVLKIRLDKHRPHKQSAVSVELPNTPWALKSNHKHVSGKDITLYHVGVNMCVQ